ncbi:hypothetical protein QJS66_13120 [Kocuria rhizophila]|nr:hypothetical protein QJS66_13120 [Kocuria rhizophila]
MGLGLGLRAADGDGPAGRARGVVGPGLRDAEHRIRRSARRWARRSRGRRCPCP